MATVTVVVVSYNTRALTLRCLDSVRAAAGVTEVVVLDNASGDGSADAIDDAFPEVEVIRSATNVGFGRAVNEAARGRTTDYLLLLNPDASLAADDVTEFLAFAAEHRSNGLYGCQIRDAHGRLDPTTARPLPSIASSLCYGTGLSTIGRGRRWFDPDAMAKWDRSSRRTVGMLSGAALLVERSVWESLDGFDDRYFVYGEDADLCLRARLAGFEPLYSPTPVITHIEGASSTSTNQQLLLLRGKATYFQLHWTGARRAFALGCLQSGVLVRRLVAALSPSDEGAANWKSVWDARAQWRQGFDEEFWATRPEPSFHRRPASPHGAT